MPEDSSKPLPEMRLLKGTADQPPQRQIRRSHIMRIIRQVYESFGYSPLETPILSHFDTLALKYGPGDPILEEIFHVTDRGKRDLGLRYDLTVPFSRFVGMALQGHFSLPFKRYEMGKVFRDGPIKEGRLREFTQCDADVVGIADPAADAECLAMAQIVFGKLGMETEIELNNRKILWGILEEAGLAIEQRDAATTAVDKWDKVDRTEIVRELTGLGLQSEQIEQVFARLEMCGSIEMIAQIRQTLHSDIAQEGLAELEGVLDAAKDFGVDLAKIRIVPRLARGLGIYTGTIFEFFCCDRSIMSSSLGSGGRFDRLIGEFLHPDDREKQGNYPCVGISFGIEPISVALDKIQPAESERKTVTDVLVVSMGYRKESFELTGRLRQAGIKADLDWGGGRLKKAFKRADQLGIPYLLLIGENEMNDGEVTFRNMQSGEQVRLPFKTAQEEIARRLR